MQSLARKLAIFGTVVGVLILIWASLGIGIIGADGEPLNAVYGLVVLTALIGAFMTKLDAEGMSKVLYAMAAIQAVIALIAIVLKWGMPYSPPLELALLNGFFVIVFVTCAQLFRFSARRTLV